MKGQTFTTMDGLRGVAAIMVVAYHAPGSAHFFPSAYLAVDLFFALSGFVLAHASMARLHTLGGFIPFVIKRVIRLYPLYLLALGLGVAVYIAKGLVEGPLWIKGAVFTLGLNVFLLPVPQQLSLDGKTAFPFVIPAWSLFYEMVINLVMAIVTPLYTKGRLLLVIAVSAVAVIFAATVHGDLNGGSSTSTAGVALARVSFSFFVGIGLYRLWKSGRLKVTIPWWSSIGLLIAVLSVPLSGTARIVGDLAIVLFVFPLLLATATGTQARPVLQFLGRISYGVYVLHGPIMMLMELMSRQVLGSELIVFGAAGSTVFLFTTIAAATLLDPLDAAVRANLSSRVKKLRASDVAGKAVA